MTIELSKPNYNTLTAGQAHTTLKYTLRTAWPRSVKVLERDMQLHTTLLGFMDITFPPKRSRNHFEPNQSFDVKLTD